MKTEIVNEPKERIDPKTKRRWIQDHETVYDGAIKKYVENSKSPNKHLIVDYLRDLRIGTTNSYNKTRVVTKSRCLRILPVLQNIDLWFKHKPFQEINTEEMKIFALNLREDILVSPTTKKPYSDATKASMLKMVRKFWKWLKKTNEFPEEVAWIATYEPRKTKEIYSYEDIDYLDRHIHSEPMRMIMWVLFDSGLRMNELLNIRLKDIIPPKDKERYFSLRVRAETSKTNKERIVGLYLSNKFLIEYLANHHQTPNDQESFLITTSYDHIRNYLRKKSIKFLQKVVTPHNLRSSSATYFASRIRSYQLFCYRYGWQLSSRVPDLYFNRSGVKNSEVMQQIHSFERTKISTEHADAMITNKDVVDENSALRRKIANMQSDLYKIERMDGILNRLLSEPEIKQKVIRLMQSDLQLTNNNAGGLLE